LARLEGTAAKVLASQRRAKWALGVLAVVVLLEGCIATAAILAWWRP